MDIFVFIIRNGPAFMNLMFLNLHLKFLKDFVHVLHLHGPGSSLLPEHAEEKGSGRGNDEKLDNNRQWKTGFEQR